MTEEEKAVYMKCCKYDKEPKEVITNLISVIQKQQEEIEEQDRTIDSLTEEQQEREKYIHSLEAQLEKKDKQIDLMAKYIKEPYCVITFGSRKPKIEIIKEYFKKKAEDK